MKVSLVVVEGRPLNQVIPLKTDRFLIGRAEDCQLRPKSQTVSSRQCAIIRRGRHVIVQDLGSTNGTLVNERCLHEGDEIQVGDGDRLQVGQLIFVFRIEAGRRENGATPEDWLMPSPMTGPVADEDMNARTLFIRYSMPSESPTAPANPVSEPPPNQAVSRFAYRSFDESRKAVALGLSQDQVEDDEAVRSLRRTLLGIASKKKGRRMILDLGAVEVLPSMSIALLLALARHCERQEGELRLCSVPQGVKRVLTTLQFDDVMASYEDRDEAVADPWV